MKARRYVPDWWLVAVDQTHDWADSIVQQANAIFAVYLFDRQRHVHCCEWTPSFECWWLDDNYTKSPPGDKAAEELNDLIQEAGIGTPAVSYYHTQDLESLLHRRKLSFHIGCDRKFWRELLNDFEGDAQRAYQAMAEGLIEYHRANSLLPR